MLWLTCLTMYHIDTHKFLLQLHILHHQRDLFHLKSASIAVNGLMVLAYMQASMRQLRLHQAQLLLSQSDPLVAPLGSSARLLPTKLLK